jgi:hypothetical protein
VYAVAVVVSTAVKLVTSNVAYNPVCFLQELVQVLQTEHIWPHRLRIVAGKHLVENRRNVHGGVLRLRLCLLATCKMTMLPGLQGSLSIPAQSFTT